MKPSPTCLIALVCALVPTATAAAPQCREIVTIDAGPQETFGGSVVMHGTTFAVYTPEYDVPNGPQDVNALVLFEKSGGTWSEAGALLAPPAVVGDWFGYLTELEGDRMLVSTALASNLPGVNDTNAIYVYQRNAGTWVLTQTLQSNAGPGVNFGFSMSLEGDRCLIGQPADSPHGSESGSVAVFERIAGTWSEVQVLDIGFWSPDFHFGSGVALAGDLALIGIMDSGAQGAFSGEVRLYERIGGSWVFRQELVPSWAAANLRIGDVLALTPNAALVSGFRGLGSHPANAGIVSVFRPDGNGDWVETEVLQGDPTDLSAGFGTDITVHGDLLGIAVPSENEPSSSDGAAYLFRDGPSGYELLNRYIAEPGETSWSGFGACMGIYGDEVVIGHPALNVDGEFLHGGLVVTRTPCLELFQSFCPCVTDTPCVAIHERTGCRNSTGVGAELAASGTPSVTLDDLVLDATHLPPNQPAVLFMGDAFGSTPLGDGLRCATGSTFRFAIASASGSGTLSSGPGLVAYSHAHFAPRGRIEAGEVWNFQLWYRDPAGPCATGSNLTSAVQVPFRP